MHTMRILEICFSVTNKIKNSAPDLHLTFWIHKCQHWCAFLNILDIENSISNGIDNLKHAFYFLFMFYSSYTRQSVTDELLNIDLIYFICWKFSYLSQLTTYGFTLSMRERKYRVDLIRSECKTVQSHQTFFVPFLLYFFSPNECYCILNQIK